VDFITGDLRKEWAKTRFHIKALQVPSAVPTEQSTLPSVYRAPAAHELVQLSCFAAEVMQLVGGT
jgi:hypothetical protein